MCIRDREEVKAIQQEIEKSLVPKKPAGIFAAYASEWNCLLQWKISAVSGSVLFTLMDQFYELDHSLSWDHK